MKCLIINALYPPIIFGGAEKSVALLAQGLCKAGHEVEVISLHTEKTTIEERVSGVSVHRIPLDNIYWPYGEQKKRSIISRMVWHVMDMFNPIAGWRVRRIIERFSPDIIHTNNIRGISVSVWRVARSLNIPVVHTLRDYSIACSRGGMFIRGENCANQCVECSIMTTVKRNASKKIDLVVSNSDFVLSRHRSIGFFDGIRGRVVFNIGNASKVATARRSEDTLTFGYIGRVEPMKGIEIVLEAFSLCREAKWKLVIAGAGNVDYVDYLKAKYEDPRVFWLGFVREEEFYSQIDICVVSSIWEEPLPRATIESLSYGKSVICSKVGGNAEIGALARKVAYYEPRSALGLAEILDECVRSPADWLSGGFRSAEAEAKISEAGVVAEYVECYQQAIASSRSAGRG